MGSRHFSSSSLSLALSLFLSLSRLSLSPLLPALPLSSNTARSPVSLLTAVRGSRSEFSARGVPAQHGDRRLVSRPAHTPELDKPTRVARSEQQHGAAALGGVGRRAGRARARGLGAWSRRRKWPGGTDARGMRRWGVRASGAEGDIRGQNGSRSSSAGFLVYFCSVPLDGRGALVVG